MFCYTIDDLDGIQNGISFKVFDSKCTLITVLEDCLIACASENGNGSLCVDFYGFSVTNYLVKLFESLRYSDLEKVKFVLLKLLTILNRF